ncbi:IS66 family insertion sequence element accessory protein TnpA [Neptunomonas antarctica]|uniref:Transposase n=1 Tax=Neptunomonas antarctica TaxID=619304 RepID=A0A1N7N660_9GAMM|nr:hypothetical protein [Neptunomonas antarctica]SIS93836.1 hypothetical protein SAMN05421760_10882 [Neptunomonas antarctica]
MTQARNKQQWQDLLDQQAISELSGAEFCRQQQIDVSQFYYHKAQRHKAMSVDDGAPAFLHAQVTQHHTPSHHALRLQHGSSELILPISTSPGWVAELMTALA